MAAASPPPARATVTVALDTGRTAAPTVLDARSSHNSTWELLSNLTMRDIHSQYKRTALGRAWSFINPLATLAILSAVFGTLLRMKVPPGTHSGLSAFVFFLAAGLIPWTFISTGIMGGMNALVGNAGLLGKVYFPRHVLVVSSVLSMLSTFLTELSVLLAIMAVFGGPRVLLFIPLLIVLAVITATFVTGLALMLSVALVYFRDTQHFMALFMQLWFYVTPIIYPISYVQTKQAELAARGTHIPVEFIWRLNPAERFVAAYRAMLYDFDLPQWQDWAWCIGWAVAMLGVGMMVFRRFSPRVVEEL